MSIPDVEHNRDIKLSSVSLKFYEYYFISIKKKSYFSTTHQISDLWSFREGIMTTKIQRRDVIQSIQTIMPLLITRFQCHTQKPISLREQFMEENEMKLNYD